ncbi:MAG TPA: hypothetical protein VH763_11840 [Gemmatimonadales bacterium]
MRAPRIERVRQHREHLGTDVDRAQEMYHDDAVLEFPQSDESSSGCDGSGHG